jgi:hypothetical protein
LTFSPGVTSQTFAVSIVNDAADEVDETVMVALSNPGNAQLGAPNQATLTIVDDDEPVPPPEVRFSAATYSVDEGAGSVEITIVLSAAIDRRVSVEFATSGGTADVGSDYEAAGSTVNVRRGTTSQTVTIDIVDDAVDEEDETVVLVLRNPTNAVLGTPVQAVLAIIDNDTTPPPASSVFLSEILPVPGGTDWDGDGTANELDEWVELYNAGPVPVDLAGWQVADGAVDSSTPYRIAADMVLDPGAFLVLYRQKTGLELGDGGDTVRLLDPAGQVVDSVTFGEIGADASYARGRAGGWYVTPLPTPGAKPVPVES